MSEHTKGHTPGPWALVSEPVGYGAGHISHREYVADASGREVCGTISHATFLHPCLVNGKPVDHSRHDYVHPTFTDRGAFPHTPDAHLIAAAPDLLAALEAAEITVSEMFDMLGGCDHDVNVCRCDVGRVRDAARAAIARARGSQP